MHKPVKSIQISYIIWNYIFYDELFFLTLVFSLKILQFLQTKIWDAFISCIWAVIAEMVREYF